MYAPHLLCLSDHTELITFRQGMDMDGIFAAKALGGCGVHNAMLYIRATPADIASWNMSSWQWDDVLETYLQLEHWVGADTSYHGKDGPMQTRYGCSAHVFILRMT